MNSDSSAGTPPSRGNTGRRDAPEPRSLVRQISTGVPGLDAVLGGGLPELSFNMLAGSPGAGKTTLAQQLIFANATVERPAIYFTVLGEPTVKMLRYQRNFDFFKPALVGSAVHYLNLSEEVLSGDLGAVLEKITREVERLRPGIVVVDSFRTIIPARGGPEVRSASDLTLEQFVQRLALHLTSWEATSLLIGEYDEPEQRQPLFTIADGIIWLTQATDRNSVVRKLQALKVRGQAQMPGLHTFRITDEGLQVFPRIPNQEWGRRVRHAPAERRLSTGVPGLDALMGGGIPAGDAVMLAGPTGTGKSTFGMLFAVDGLRNGESVVVAGFEEYPEAYLARLRSLDVDTEALIAAGKLRITYLRPLDLSVDETLADILTSVRETGASRVVIDSLTGFEAALAPTFREDFRESLYRLVGALTSTDVTVFMIHEALSVASDAGYTGERVSFITDDIIVQSYAEIDGVMEKVLTIIKMRRSAHSTELRRYEITARGAVMGERLAGYDDILSGSPARRVGERTAVPVGLTGPEWAMLDTLVRVGESSLAALAASSDLPIAGAEAIVDRLLAMRYVVRSGDGAASTYRAVARAAGP